MDKITIESEINAPVEKVWEAYTDPGHIIKWNHASDDWHSPRAENDLREGGRFSFRMEAKDSSEGFDFAGMYTEVVPKEKLSYEFGGRKATVSFEDLGESTRVTIAFDPEEENPEEMQRSGWQAILDNFKRYVEAN